MQHLQRPRTQYVKAQDFYVDYYASDLETAERFTHTYSMSQNEIRKYQLAGMFRDTEVWILQWMENLMLKKQQMKLLV